MVSDAQLIQQSVAGDTKAFGTLVERYKQLACALAYDATGNSTVSEEIAQQAFVVAWRNLSRLESPAHLRPWLRSIIRNIAGDWFRRCSRDNRRLAALEQSPSQRSPENPREAAIARERQEIVWEAIKEMPEAYRVALVLYYREEMSVQKVAEALHLSPDAAKQRLARGSAMVRERLSAVVEETLRRTGPGEGFSAAVLAALPRALPATGAPFAQDIVGRAVGSWLGAKGLSIASAGLAAVVILGGLGLFLSGSPAPSPALAASPAVSAPLPAAAGEATAASATPKKDETPQSATAIALALARTEMPAPAQETASLPPVYVVPAGYPGTDPSKAGYDTISGTVYSSQGKPAAGATVWAARYGHGVLDAREVQTHPDGSYELHVPRGVWMLRARLGDESAVAPLKPRGIYSSKGKASSVECNITMLKQGRVTGRILDRETGQPVPHARIWTDDEHLVEAGDDGSYALDGISPNAHCLFVVAPGHQRRYIQFCTKFRPTCELEISLARAGTVKGRVVSEDGRPVAFAWIEAPASLWGAGSGLFELCDEQGRFTFDGPPFGYDSTLIARIPSYYGICGDPYPQWTKAGACESKTIRVREGETAPEVVFKLHAAPLAEQIVPSGWSEPEPRGVVRGKVLGPDGRPVRNFRVLLQLPVSPEVPSAQVTSLEINSLDRGFSFTADDGAFTLTTHDLEPGKFVRLVATADGVGEAAQDVVRVAPIGQASYCSPALFRLTQPHSLTVRVTSAGGVPVSGAEVTLVELVAKRQHRNWLNGRLDGLRPAKSTSDARGEARFAKLDAASGDIAIHKEGYAHARVIWRGENEIKVALQPGCVVEGVLFDQWQQRLLEGSVLLNHSDGPLWSYGSPEDDVFQVVLRPQDNGTLRINDLPPGHYTVNVDAKPVLVQVGIDHQGKPVTMVSSESHIFYQEFTLEAGQAYRFICPDDSAQRNPSEWRSSGVSDDDRKLMSNLVGTWVSKVETSSGQPVFTVEHYASDGRHLRRSYTTGSQPFSQSGYFKVSRGLLNLVSDNASFVGLECSVSSDNTTLTLRATDSDTAYSYRRASSLKTAVADITAIVGPPPPPPYTPIDPIPLPDYPVGMSTFIPAESS